MKSRTLKYITAITLFAMLAFPFQLGAQHARYTLIDISTFGGPASYLTVPGLGSGFLVLNNRGVLAGKADTATPDPFCGDGDPDCFLAHVFRWQQGVLTDLGALPGGWSDVGEINARGWIVGDSRTGEIDPLTGGPAFHAVIWKSDEIIDLGTLGGPESGALNVTNGGEVIGSSSIDTVPNPFFFASIHPFLWKNGVMLDLGTLGGPDAFAAAGCAIERDGLVAGQSLTNLTPNATTGFPTQHAFLWENGTMTDIPTLGGTLASAQCGNNQGQVIGHSSLVGDVGCPDSCAQHAFSWDHGALTDLGTLGGSFSIANWLNNTGEAVGGATTIDDELFHATRWRNGQITDLGTLPADCFSVAMALNSRSQIVGKSISCDGSIERAVPWDKGSIVDLNQAIPSNSSLFLLEPDNINERGEIVGRGAPPGCDNLDLCGHVFLLIPCDRAGTRCEGNAGISARTGSPAITTKATTSTQRRHMTKEFVAQLRTRLARRYHIPRLGRLRDQKGTSPPCEIYDKAYINILSKVPSAPSQPPLAIFGLVKLQ
jgi:probable HAF family extracellular repeat protein